MDVKERRYWFRFEHPGQIIRARESDEDRDENEYSHARKEKLLEAAIAAADYNGCHGSSEAKRI
jgi:hypothetical protein